jgi:hypothetical protein
VAEFTAGVEPGTDSANELYEFASAHVGEVVYLDVGIEDDEDVFVREDDEPAVITIPDASGEREGVEYVITDLGDDTDSSLGWVRGAWLLRGYFAVQGIGGPHQGSFSVAMRAVPITDVEANGQGEASDETSGSGETHAWEGFILPSGNIYCLAYDDGIECQITSGLNPPP